MLLAFAFAALLDGRSLFDAKCASCHAIAAVKDPIAIASASAPSLAYAGSKFRREWLVSWLSSPSPIRPAGFPSFRHVITTLDGDRLDEASIPRHVAISASDAETVAGFLMTLRQPAAAVPHADSNGKGELQFGKLLPCGGCHRAAPDRGGVSGPELFTASRRLRDDWMAAFVSDPPAWPASLMPKLALKPEQLSSLLEFIESRVGQAPPPVPSSVAATHVTLDRANRSHALYQIYCTQCHGLKGDGKGINAAALFISPRNHTSADEMGMLTDDRLFAAIKYGGTAVGKSALMPPWNGTIADDDIRLLVGYVRSLSGTQIADEAMR